MGQDTRTAGLEPAESDIFFAIEALAEDGGPEPTVRELISDVRDEGMTPEMIRDIVKTLERKGLITVQGGMLYVAEETSPPPSTPGKSFGNFGAGQCEICGDTFEKRSGTHLYCSSKACVKERAARRRAHDLEYSRKTRGRRSKALRSMMGQDPETLELWSELLTDLHDKKLLAGDVYARAVLELAVLRTGIELDSISSFLESDS